VNHRAKDSRTPSYVPQALLGTSVLTMTDCDTMNGIVAIARMKKGGSVERLRGPDTEETSL